MQPRTSLAQPVRRDGVQLDGGAVELLGARIGLLGRARRQVPVVALLTCNRRPLEMDLGLRCITPELGLNVARCLAPLPGAAPAVQACRAPTSPGHDPLFRLIRSNTATS